MADHLPRLVRLTAKSLIPQRRCHDDVDLAAEEIGAVRFEGLAPREPGTEV